MRFLIAIFLLAASNAAFSSTSCGVVNIEQVLSNKVYGSLMKVDNDDCGKKGWVCLDPKGEYLGKEVSDRLYAQVLAAWASEKPVTLSTAGSNNVYTDSCGGSKRAFPVVDDFRS